MARINNLNKKKKKEQAINKEKELKQKKGKSQVHLNVSINCCNNSENERTGRRLSATGRLITNNILSRSSETLDKRAEEWKTQFSPSTLKKKQKK